MRFHRLPASLLSHSLLFPGLIVACLLTSCARQSGPAIETVHGTATLDGQPIEEGEILFRPQDATKSGGGGKISRGKFSFQTPAGDMRVEITAYRVVPGKFVEANPGEKDPVTEQYIPEQYNRKSDLTATVDSKHREFKFELVGNKK